IRSTASGPAGARRRRGSAKDAVVRSLKRRIRGRLTANAKMRASRSASATAARAVISARIFFKAPPGGRRDAGSVRVLIVLITYAWRSRYRPHGHIDVGHPISTKGTGRGPRARLSRRRGSCLGREVAERRSGEACTGDGEYPG